MKVYISHSRDFDYTNELYKPLRESELNTTHSFILPHEESDHPYPTRELFASKECDLVIAEVSFPSTGQGIELGWASLLDIPVVCLYKDGAEPSGSLSMVSKKLLMYTSIDNMIEDITGVLKEYE